MEVATPTRLRPLATGDINSPFLRKSAIKGYVQNVVRDLLEEMGITACKEGVPNLKALPKKIKDSIESSVRELILVNADGLEEKLGTIVFLKQDLAITCFHEVFRRGRILESNLHVDGKALTHVVSFPYYDMTFYKCPGREDGWLELGDVESIGIGGLLYLASYPSIAKSEAEDSNLVICSGTVCRKEDPTGLGTVLGQYQCFPGSSGGAILSSTGKLLGIHLESLYHEDGSFLQPPDWYYDCLPSEAIRVLEWGKGVDQPSQEDFWEKADSEKVLKYAAQNVSSKGHLGRFQSLSIIRMKLLEEGLLPRRGRKRSRNVLTC